MNLHVERWRAVNPYWTQRNQSCLRMNLKSRLIQSEAHPCWYGLIYPWQVVVVEALSFTFGFKSHHLVRTQQLKRVGWGFEHVVLVHLPGHHVHTKLVLNL